MRVIRLVAAPIVTIPLLFGVSSVASAQSTGSVNPDIFAQCPVNGRTAPKPSLPVSICIVGVASTGSISIGDLSATFHGPGLAQGGYNPGSNPQTLDWSQALNGQSFTAPPQLLPKNVVALLGYPQGVTLPSNLNVTVVTQQAGPIGFAIAEPGVGGLTPTLQVPLSFHLVNPLLGPNCYVGVSGNPVTLNLTVGTSGALTGELGYLSGQDNGNVIQTTGTEVVDNVYSVPGATGCGSGGVWDNAIDSNNALPSSSGANQAILYGTFDLASAKWVKHQLGE